MRVPLRAGSRAWPAIGGILIKGRKTAFYSISIQINIVFVASFTCIPFKTTWPI
jgi:hypothetical protein